MIEQSARPEKKRGGAIIVLVVLVILPMVYAFSLGPAVWLHKHGIARNQVEVAYAPLRWLRDHNVVAEEFWTSTLICGNEA